MSSCFILPANFDKKLSSLSELQLKKTSSKKIENKSLNLNSPPAFHDTCSHLDFNANDEDSNKYCFITFYTKYARSQNELMKVIKNDWEILNNNGNENIDSNDSATDNDSPIPSLDASIYQPLKLKPKQHARASINDLGRSTIYYTADQDLDEATVEEEEEEPDENNDNNNKNNNNDISDYDDDDDDIENILTQSQFSYNDNNVLMRYSLKGDHYVDDIDF